MVTDTQLPHWAHYWPQYCPAQLICIATSYWLMHSMGSRSSMKAECSHTANGISRHDSYSEFGHNCVFLTPQQVRPCLLHENFMPLLPLLANRMLWLGTGTNNIISQHTGNGDLICVARNTKLCAHMKQNTIATSCIHTGQSPCISKGPVGLRPATTPYFLPHLYGQHLTWEQGQVPATRNKPLDNTQEVASQSEATLFLQSL